jgi:DNA-binding PadR family transcriptional regulator
MSRTRAAGLSAGEAVLGLVIEQPDRGFSLERRLEQRFGAARFSYSTAYNALYRMERQGLVRVAGGGARGSGAAPSSGDAVYEATAKGIEHFRNWVRSSTHAPVLREEIHARVALCEPRDVPRLIEILHAEELSALAELDGVRERIIAERRGAAGGDLAEQWSALMGRGVADAEAAFWGGRINQLARLRAYLEDLREEAERRSQEEYWRERSAGRKLA